MCIRVEQIDPSTRARSFFRNCARKSTRLRIKNSQAEQASLNFSTDPQRSSQQQALDMYFYLADFVKALVPVKIIG